MSDALVAFPVRGCRRVPFHGPPRARVGRSRPMKPARSVVEALSTVPDLEHDKALPRTRLARGSHHPHQLGARPGDDLAQVGQPFGPFFAAPNPLVETFVWCPWFEALHVRFGLVARGGVRWSDRQADLRSEVLGLARAQVKKNSLIVPTGAKGAFVLRREPTASNPGTTEKRLTAPL